MRGALSSGIDLIYAKALVQGKANGSDSINIRGVTIEIESGYPVGLWNNSMRYIVGLDGVGFTFGTSTICENDWCGLGNQNSLPSGITVTAPLFIGKVYPKGKSYDDECGVYLINNSDGKKPVVELEINDC